MKNQPFKAGFLHSDGFVLNVYAVTRHRQELLFDATSLH